MKSAPIFNPRPAPKARQTRIFYDRQSYSAFPHVVRLEGDELLIAFRQAPDAEIVKHSHPRSVITVIRSYDLGETWETESASQMAAGGEAGRRGSDHPRLLCNRPVKNQFVRSVSVR